MGKRLTTKQEKTLDNLAELLKGSRRAGLLRDVEGTIRRDHRLNVRVTQREKDLIDALAARFNTNRTQLIVGLAETVAGRLAGTPHDAARTRCSCS